jgi:hypothetical protein
MKMWLDTEFNEQLGQTISIGIIADNGAEFYEVLYMRENPTEWVAKNVLPVLGRQPIEFSDLQPRLLVWLRQFDGLQIVVDHPADIQRFLQLLETNQRGGWAEVPHLTFEIVTGLVGSQKQYSTVEHNALSDARALQERCKLQDQITSEDDI